MTEQLAKNPVPAMTVPIPAADAPRHPDPFVALQQAYLAADDPTRVRFLRWAGLGG